MLVLLSVIAAVALPIWLGLRRDQIGRITRHAKSLGYQIMEGQKLRGRAPASVSAASGLNRLAVEQGEIGQEAFHSVEPCSALANWKSLKDFGPDSSKSLLFRSSPSHLAPKKRQSEGASCQPNCLLQELF